VGAELVGSLVGGWNFVGAAEGCEVGLVGCIDG
jgi:hypothetical protein